MDTVDSLIFLLLLPHNKRTFLPGTRVPLQNHPQMISCSTMPATSIPFRPVTNKWKDSQSHHSFHRHKTPERWIREARLSFRKETEVPRGQDIWMSRCKLVAGAELGSFWPAFVPSLLHLDSVELHQPIPVQSNAQWTVIRTTGKNQLTSKRLIQQPHAAMASRNKNVLC